MRPVTWEPDSIPCGHAMPTLDLITLYPVKSLDGVDVAAARVLPSGALENDRRWRLVDMEGRVVNAKRTPLFHAIRAEFALDERLVTLCVAPAALTAAAIPGIDRLQNLGLARAYLEKIRSAASFTAGERAVCAGLLAKTRANIPRAYELAEKIRPELLLKEEQACLSLSTYSSLLS
jgi:hypothetical protein